MSKKFDLPNFNLPNFEPPKFDLPKLDLPKIDLPKIDPPKIDLPKFDFPKIDPPKFDLPKLDLPKIDLPKIDPPKFDMKKFEKDMQTLQKSLEDMDFDKTFKSAETAKKWHKRQTIFDPDAPKHVRGWYLQELRQRGLSKPWRNPPGFDMGHNEPGVHKPSNIRHEDTATNQNRNIIARWLGISDKKR